MEGSKQIDIERGPTCAIVWSRRNVTSRLCVMLVHDRIPRKQIEFLVAYSFVSEFVVLVQQIYFFVE